MRSRSDSRTCCALSILLVLTAVENFAFAAKPLELAPGAMLGQGSGGVYFAVGEPGTHANNEGDHLGALHYSALSDCDTKCDETPNCMHYTACPGDGNKCYFKRGDLALAQESGSVTSGRSCQMYFRQVFSVSVAAGMAVQSA